MNSPVAIVLICILIGAISQGGARAETAPKMSAAINGRAFLEQTQWMAPETDVAAALTTEPGQCVETPAEDEAQFDGRGDRQIKLTIGQAAFANPLLLGGEAARMGLSCNSCHINGHGNPNFFLADLSGAPGTADVTHSLFSKTREDHIFNPRPIPSLLDVGEKEAFGTIAPKKSLSAFVENAIVSEFQGAPPDPLVLEGLVYYVESLKGSACRHPTIEITVGDELKQVERELNAALASTRRGDNAAADFLVSSVRGRLGRVYNRYHDQKLSAERAMLKSLSSDLGKLHHGREPHDASFLKALTASLESVQELSNTLIRSEQYSYYNKRLIEAALAGQESVDPDADPE